MCPRVIPEAPEAFGRGEKSKRAGELQTEDLSGEATKAPGSGRGDKGTAQALGRGNAGLRINGREGGREDGSK